MSARAGNVVCVYISILMDDASFLFLSLFPCPSNTHKTTQVKAAPRLGKTSPKLFAGVCVCVLAVRIEGTVQAKVYKVSHVNLSTWAHTERERARESRLKLTFNYDDWPPADGARAPLFPAFHR